jgi:hypothetical protein
MNISSTNESSRTNNKIFDVSQRITVENVLYISAFVLALILRFVQLGNAPLAETEAQWANYALQLTNASPGLAIGEQPAYIFLTSLVFSIFNDNEFTARFWSALSGSLLVLAPLLIIRKSMPNNSVINDDQIIQTKRASEGVLTAPSIRIVLILLSFGLAIDPGLVTVSRQAGGSMMALSFSILGLAAWIGGWHHLAGVLTGIALLTGPSFFYGAIGIAVASFLVFSQLGFKSDAQAKVPADTLKPGDQKTHIMRSRSFIEFTLTAAITFLVVGTFFFRFPQGIGAWLASLQVYFQGWLQPIHSISAQSNIFTQAIPPQKVILALIVYELFPLVFFLLGLTHSLLHKKRIQPRLFQWLLFSFAWTGFSLFITLAYPARQISNLIWCLVPIWFVAAWEISAVFPFSTESIYRRQKNNIEGKTYEQGTDPVPIPNRVTYTEPVSSNVVSAILGSFIFILLALFWFTLSALTLRSVNPSLTTSFPFDYFRWLVPAGTLVLIMLLTALVSLGWSSSTGRQGLYWGITLALLLYNFSVLWGSAYLRANQPNEFWSHSPGTGQAWALRQTLDSLSLRESGALDYLNIISAVDTPSMRWLLRNNSQIRFVNEPGAGDSPDVVITWANQEYPVLSASYSGQDIAWWRWPGWEGGVPPAFIRWFNYREAPQISENIILWARVDLIRNQDEPISNGSGETPAEGP